MTETDTRLGAMGLPFVEVGEIVQSLARCIVDRGNYSEDAVREALLAFDEVPFWDYVGGLIDQLEIELFGATDICLHDGIEDASDCPKAPRLVAGVRCVKCDQIIRTDERINYGDGTGLHIVCPTRPL